MGTTATERGCVLRVSCIVGQPDYVFVADRPGKGEVEICRRAMERIVAPAQLPCEGEDKAYRFTGVPANEGASNADDD